MVNPAEEYGNEYEFYKNMECECDKISDADRLPCCKCKFEAQEQ